MANETTNKFRLISVTLVTEKDVGDETARRNYLKRHFLLVNGVDGGGVRGLPDHKETHWPQVVISSIPGQADKLQITNTPFSGDKTVFTIGKSTPMSGKVVEVEITNGKDLRGSLRYQDQLTTTIQPPATKKLVVPIRVASGDKVGQKNSEGGQNRPKVANEKAKPVAMGTTTPTTTAQVKIPARRKRKKRSIKPRNVTTRTALATSGFSHNILEVENQQVSALRIFYHSTKWIIQGLNGLDCIDTRDLYQIITGETNAINKPIDVIKKMTDRLLAFGKRLEQSQVSKV